MQESIYIKDLRVIANRELKDIVMVDNAVYSFGHLLANGIPVVPFKDDTDDTEFQDLMLYFDELRLVDDMREANKLAFNLHKISQIQLDNFIKYYHDE